MDESEVLEWMVKQKNDESIEEIDRDELFTYIETKEFLAVVFCKYLFICFTCIPQVKASVQFCIDIIITFQIKTMIQIVRKF